MRMKGEKFTVLIKKAMICKVSLYFYLAITVSVNKDQRMISSRNQKIIEQQNEADAI